MTKPFNLEAFLAGAPAETKSGLKVVDYKYWKQKSAFSLSAMLDNGCLHTYTDRGTCHAHMESFDDLVMSTQKRVIEGWVNVYKDGFSSLVFKSHAQGYNFAMEDGEYIRTIKITDEIEE